MKRWACVTALLYILILAVLYPGAMAVALFFPDISELFSENHYRWYLAVEFWLSIGALFLAQLGLLVIPVRRESGRPLKRRHVASLILSTGLMFGLLVCGLYMTIGEVLQGENFFKDRLVPVSWSVIAGSWLVWAVVFMLIGRRQSGVQLFDSARKRLLQGSILELLVVVPCHIYVRTKDYCCAGYSTFWGIAFGVSVMLFAFGPAVFVLFAQQIGHTRKARQSFDTRNKE